MSAESQTPTAAYVHVPFCAHRCGYCNFTLVAGRDDLIDPYLQALELELAQLEQPRQVDTLFLGGGTPSHLPPDKLSRLLNLVLHWFPLSPTAEFSAEANPDDLDKQHAHIFGEAGVTRISLGAQSFNAAKLHLLERDHSATDIEEAVVAAREAGTEISLDLIFGLPQESLETWRNDLLMALQLAPDHISTYGLTIEKGTAFWKRRATGELVPGTESDELSMYQTGIETLTEARFEHYEVSNFAQPNRYCRHNECYWTGGSYYAAGPGAARYVDGVRESNHRSTTTYIRRLLMGKSPVADREKLGPEAAVRERIVFGLRRLVGIDIDRLRR
ncbi:MAG: radical SAM family heme chaperone HemW, partial [Planctomycetales bacterium]